MDFLKKDLKLDFKIDEKLAQTKSNIVSLFKGTPEEGEWTGLQVSVKSLKKDRNIIDQFLLTPLEELNAKGKLSLSAQSRIFNLKKLLEILDETIVSVENFEAEDEIIEKMSPSMRTEVPIKIKQKCAELHQYCKSDIKKDPIDFSEDDHGQEVEDKTAILHDCIEGVLETLKDIGTDLKEAGVVTPEPLKHDDDVLYEDPLVNTTPGFRGRRDSSDETPTLGRRLSFVSHGAMLVVGSQGQVDMDNSMVAESLLKQLPLKK